MAIALVGSAGTIASAAAATITPAFAQGTTAGNLLVARVAANQGIASSSSGWVRAAFAVNSAFEADIWYKANCGAGEAAPTFTATSGTQMYADLTEWSGVAVASPLDSHHSGAIGSSSPAAATNDANDADASDLAIGCAWWNNSKSATYTITTTWTPASGTKTAEGNTGATKTLQAFMASAYLLNTHGGGAADVISFGVTPSTGVGNGWACAVASFKPQATVVASDPGRSEWRHRQSGLLVR